MARGGGLGDIVLEPPGRPAEGALHAIGGRGAPPVANVREETGEQPSDVERDAVRDRLLDLVLVPALRAWCAGPGASVPS